MKQKIIKIVSIVIVFTLALLFVAKFAGEALLRLYVETGVGNCQKIPILCMAPKDIIIEPTINEAYLKELISDQFPDIEISVPIGFTIIKEKIRKTYYREKGMLFEGAVIYLLYEEPDFFIGLYPQLKKQGIDNNFEFVRRTMYANINKIENLTDVFFVVMKGIFIPNLGDQNKVTMAQFKLGDKMGFINYNLSDTVHFFDCNVINRKGDFFKIYINDPTKRLNLDNVFAIISTIGKIR